MTKTSKPDQPTESYTWVIAMVIVVVAIVVAVIAAIWHQHRQLISEAAEPTAYSQSN